MAGESATIAGSEDHVHRNTDNGGGIGFETQSLFSTHKDLQAILSNIQHPHSGPWGFHDVNWTMKLSGERGSNKKSVVVQQCYVNSNRANDFIASMEGGKDGMVCKYFVSQRYGFKSTIRARFNSPLLFRRFQCTYGPQDHSGFVKKISPDMLPKSRRKPHPVDRAVAVPKTNRKPIRKPRAQKLSQKGSKTSIPLAAQIRQSSSGPSVEFGETSRDAPAETHDSNLESLLIRVEPVPLSLDLNVHVDPIEVDSIMHVNPDFTFDLNEVPESIDDVIVIPPPRTIQSRESNEMTAVESNAAPKSKAVRVTKKMQVASLSFAQGHVTIPKKQVRNFDRNLHPNSNPDLPEH